MILTYIGGVDIDKCCFGKLRKNIANLFPIGVWIWLQFELDCPILIPLNTSLFCLIGVNQLTFLFYWSVFLFLVVSLMRVDLWLEQSGLEHYLINSIYRCECERSILTLHLERNAYFVCTPVTQKSSFKHVVSYKSCTLPKVHGLRQHTYWVTVCPVVRFVMIWSRGLFWWMG